MAILRWPPKDAGDTLDYTLDWSRWLAPSDFIAQSSWFIPAGLSLTIATHTSTTTTAWISGAGTGPLMDVQNRVVTAQGRTCTKTVTLPINSSTY